MFSRLNESICKRNHPIFPAKAVRKWDFFPSVRYIPDNESNSSEKNKKIYSSFHFQAKKDRREASVPSVILELFRIRLCIIL